MQSDLHHQVVVLSEEIGTPMTISSVAWHAASYYIYTDNTCSDFTLYMGLTDQDALSTASFEGNYIPGTRTQVFSTPELFIDKDDQWPTVILDEPYFYNGEHNLIIEITWDNSGTGNSHYTWCWGTQEGRGFIVTAGNDPYPMSGMLHMILSGSLAFDNSTFGSIKVELGR